MLCHMNFYPPHVMGDERERERERERVGEVKAVSEENLYTIWAYYVFSKSFTFGCVFLFLFCFFHFSLCFLT